MIFDNRHAILDTIYETPTPCHVLFLKIHGGGLAIVYVRVSELFGYYIRL